ncbi:hypothetical protein D3C80_2101860 [compost metagenome]
MLHAGSLVGRLAVVVRCLGLPLEQQVQRLPGRLVGSQHMVLQQFVRQVDVPRVRRMLDGDRRQSGIGQAHLGLLAERVVVEVEIC